ncbi:uncharacterized protein K452DRAFT_292836 [Aplosporella prunicola CBS 121167]|uniref:Ribonuclease H2 subunit B n=1 Tax=Aplosporella prunicola CBS 121167 TaxID=1176127 RepID=A0A6A6AY52_9PEZI|nr:uncharacterized protein K452DRAFT_292836 [Aplosporella prunicola CBS 121167]KAF2135905.1 hypothetical protein K452DRAFT_292836 [Aplosporella prunicola CBS 121167]
MPASVADPPKLFVLPKNVSDDARIVTIPNPATATQSRYYCCPQNGFYEFTRIAAPKSAPRSWLLAPERATKEEQNPESNGSTQEMPDAPEEPSEADGDVQGPLEKGYTLKSPDVFVATPLDALFLILPALAPSAKDQKQMFLSADDHLDSLSSSSAHLRALITRQTIRQRLEERMAAVCDTVDAGDEKMYRLSIDKLVGELVAKAEKLVDNGLPASMEERFVRKALEVPVMNIRREESTISAATVEGAEVETPGAGGSQTASNANPETQNSAESQTAAATSTAEPTDTVKPAPAKPAIVAPEGVPRLLRLRTAIEFMSTSYLLTALRSLVQTALKSNKPIDFTTLDAHLEHLSSLRSQAQALRSLSDNISRKRGVDDDEAAEVRAEKKRKKEEDDLKKKNQSRGVKQLAKVNTTGMKKLSAFFTKAPAKKE